MKTGIKALIFDQDGLLFDSERIVRRSWNIAGEELGYPGLGEHIYNTLGFNLIRRTQYFKETIGADFPMDAFNLITRKAFSKIQEKEGVPLKPGVKELLEYGRENGLRMAVATSSRKVYSEGLLKSGGIYGYFDAHVTGDMIAKAKPDPEIYRKACGCVGVKPEEAMALEDAPNGIRAAHAAGMYPVMVPDLVKPDEEIKKLCFRVCGSLEEVPDILKKMGGFHAL